MDKLSNLIKDKFSNLPNSFLIDLEGLFITDSEIVKKDKFKGLLNIFKENKDPQLLIEYETIFLTIFLLEVNKYFNTELISIFKNSNKEELIVRIIKTMLLDSTNTADSLDNLLKIKIKLFNSLTEFFRQYKIDFKLFSCHIFTSYYEIIREIELKIDCLTVDFIQPIINFFKIFLSLTKNIDKSKEDIYNINSLILEELRIILLEKEFPFFYRDLEFSIASSYLNLVSILKNKNEYIENVEKIITRNLNNIKKTFLFYKAANIYLPKDCEELSSSFIEKTIKSNNISIEEYNYDNFFVFYCNFLKTERIFDAELTALINDIFIMIVKRLLCLNLKKIVEERIREICIIEMIYDKMKKDKFNFSSFDENYLTIIELFNSEFSFFKKSIEDNSYKYLNDALKSREKINRTECRIFIFLQKTEKENTILSDFLSLIFQDTSVRSFNIIFEYFKILSDIFLKDKKTFENYDFFARSYSEYFVTFLTIIDTKYLKLMNNLLINFEKFDKNFYALLIYYFYHKKIHNNDKLNEEDYFNKTFSIFFCLMKPYKNHKKILSLNKKNILYKNCIFEKELSFEIPYEKLKWASYSSDRFLIIYMMDIIIELDEPEIGFCLIKNVMKYSLKNTYPESKSSLMKAFQVYFYLFFEKIQRSLQKKNGLTEAYVKIVFNILEYLTKFINKNVFDRPPELLQSVLEIYYFIIQNYDITSKIQSNNGKQFMEKLNNFCKTSFFNNGICLSLISLLRNSWYFIRFYSFNILKHHNFKDFLWKIKNSLLGEILRDLLSLRHMETEGASNLFMLLSFHFGEKFYLDFSSSILKQRTNDSSIQLIYDNNNDFNLNQKILLQINSIINILGDKYLLSLEQNKEIFNYKYSLHSFYIIMKSILEEEKLQIGKSPCNLKQVELFSDVVKCIYKNLKIFTKYLLNNGVSEFSIENGSNSGGQGHDDFLDYENKKMISIWYTTRFGNEALNLILDILSSRAYIMLVYEYESKSNFFQELLDISIKLMLDYHHMGVIETLNESVLKICKILNYNENPAISNLTYNKLEELLVDKLVKEELSSILRRSAGLPYLITTLIKSYTSEEKFSFSRIKSILNLTISKLIENYKKCQFTNSDASVHSLNILRIIVYDAVLKPYVKEFVDIIFLDLLDGLKSKNWSIKNSCMLLFSNIIKNLFHHSYSEKYIPTFVEYFGHKTELKSKIYNLISDDSALNNNDCLILLLNFFSKFKKTKNNETENQDLNKYIQVIYNLRNHNNNFVRKASVDALITLYGSRIKVLLEIIKDEIQSFSDNPIQKELSFNKNSFDFITEFLLKLIKQTDFEIEKHVIIFENIFLNLKEIFLKLKFLENKEDQHYIVFFNISKLLSAAIKTDMLIKNINIKNHILELTQKTNLNNYEVLSMIRNKSSVPFFYKSLKNIFKLYIFNNVDMFLEKFSVIVERNLSDDFNPSQNLKLNELFKFYLSKFHKYYVKNSSKSIIKILLQGKIFKDINITSKLLECLIKTKFSEVFSSEEVLSVSSVLVEFIENNPAVTKIARKILILLAEIFSFPLKLKGEFSRILLKNEDILHQIYRFIICIKNYSLSNNEEKLRYNSLTALNILIISLTNISQNDIDSIKIILSNNNKIKEEFENVIVEVLLILTLTLNDEHPEIRNHSSKIFNNLNKICGILPFSPFYNSEYILKKLITKVSLVEDKLKSIFKMDFNMIIKKFYTFLISENLYFDKVNSEEKVFYFEPDNRFIDNIQLKSDIYNTIVKNNIELEIIKTSNKNKDLGIMMMVEDFTDLFKKQVINLINKREKVNLEYNKFRELIYKDITTFEFN